MNKKAEQRIELLILVLLIILQIADFLEILPGDLDYVKKIISWTALGYIFIKASLSTILFGHKKSRFDTGIILTYFLFVVKDLIGYAGVAIEEVVIFEEFYSFLLANSFLIEKYCFYLGGILLLFISLYMALKFSIKKPSFMAILHETGKPPKTTTKFILRFFTVFIVLVAFFVIIFNLAAEWLAIVLDAPLAVIAILLYLFVIIRHHKKFHVKHFIYKIGSVGEEFYENFIKMFHYKRSLYLGIMGLLALHLLTDVGVFIIPYIVGLKDVLYFGQLGEGHTPLIQLLTGDLSSLSGIAIPSLIITYLFNVIAMLFLLILPTFIWYRFFKKKHLHVSRTSLALVFSSLLCFALTPAFFIKRIKLRGLVGVDILTQSILKSSSIIDSVIQNREAAIILVAALSIILGLVLWILEFNKKIEKDIFVIAVLIGLVFFGFYTFYYFMSFWQYYLNTIIFLFKSNEVLIGVYFILFAIITLLFYIGGYSFFIYEVFKKHFLKRFFF